MSKYYIANYSVKNLWGYKNYKITFFKDVNVLIGPNASGKTTLINILYDTLTANVSRLCRTEFSEVTIGLKSFVDGSVETISVAKTSEDLLITVGNRACLRHARCGEKKDLVGAEMERVASHLKQELLHAVALDIAARRSPSPPAVLPDRIEQLLLDNARPDIDPAKVAALVAVVEVQLDPKVIKAAQVEVKRFLGQRCITHLLKGHLVLGVLRRVFLRAATKESGINASIPNDALTQILADMVWRRCQSDDHKQLKRAVRTKTRKLVSQYPTILQPVPSVA